MTRPAFTGRATAADRSRDDMDSIPVEYITWDGALRNLENIFKKNGYIFATFPVKDVFRQWVHEQEKEYYLSQDKPAPFVFDATGSPSTAVAGIGLEKLRLAVIHYVSPELLDATVSTSEHTSFVIDEIVMQIRGYVWAESESVQRQEVKYPSDWWEAWKLRFSRSLPKWFLRKYPVKYRVVVLDVKAIYPTFKPAMQEKTARLVIQRTNTQ